jgi:DNA modification methylase
VLKSNSRESRQKRSAAADLRVSRWSQSYPELRWAYRTDLGTALVGKSEKVLLSRAGRALKGRVQLVFSSPPFPLNRKKKYGNLEGKHFREWLSGYATALRSLLRPDGSIVIEMGNAWEAGAPIMSTLAMETLLAFKKAGKFHLCQEFIWFNPARLPTPAQWVTVNRWRMKDAFTRLWWMSPSPYPKADNRRVLQPYSGSMKTLLETGKYNAGKRPSGHKINRKSFLTNNGGAIPPNVLLGEDAEASNLLVEGNTHSSDDYHKYCRERGLLPHPARMPLSLAKFFVNFCTDEGDIVLDPFAGSNTTGSASESLRRQWISIEAREDYAFSGIGRFPNASNGPLWHVNADMPAAPQDAPPVP